MGKILQQIEKIQGILVTMDKRFDSMDGRINTVERSINQIMDFLKEHMLMRQEAYEIFVTKDEAKVMKDELLTAIDGNTKKVNDFDAELAAGRSHRLRLEGRVDKIEKKMGIASA
ncbi:hypothetical protein KJ611_00135 [Patescibacteria group bacterium]|nr:hypothetical protein [Patescibacteria group bacterium]MBU1705649.1 hypothetical protein [Patescibacteria group bacterium]